MVVLPLLAQVGGWPHSGPGRNTAPMNVMRVASARVQRPGSATALTALCFIRVFSFSHWLGRLAGSFLTEDDLFPKFTDLLIRLNEICGSYGPAGRLEFGTVPS